MAALNGTAGTRALPRFIGVRHRVTIIVLAVVLAVGTQGAGPGLFRTVEQNDTPTLVEINGEQLPFACQGSGSKTVLFLHDDSTRSIAGMDEVATEVAGFAHVCTVQMASLGARSAGTGANAALISPDRADRIARDLGGALADATLPAPYIIVAPVDLEPIVVRFAGPAGPAGPASGPANSGLLLIPQQQPMTGWIITPAGDRREVKLGTIDHIVVHIRSLVWPLRGA